MDLDQRAAQRQAAGGDPDAAIRSARMICRVEGHIHDTFKREHPIRHGTSVEIRVCFRCFNVEAGPVGQLHHESDVPLEAFRGDAGWVIIKKGGRKAHVLNQQQSGYRGNGYARVITLCGSTQVSALDLSNAKLVTAEDLRLLASREPRGRAGRRVLQELPQGPGRRVEAGSRGLSRADRVPLAGSPDHARAARHDPQVRVPPSRPRRELSGGHVRVHDPHERGATSPGASPRAAGRSGRTRKTRRQRLGRSSPTRAGCSARPAWRPPTSKSLN
jgi:hypothetical protein